MARRVSALHPERDDRVRVELDGEQWRTLPAAAVVSAGLSVGTALDRDRARELARAVRHAKALRAASRALAHRDRSAAGLTAYLGRRGIRGDGSARAVATLTRAGYVDDERFAADRAVSLAGRGYGDDGIRFELARQGLGAEEIAAALETIAPEAERALALVGQAPPTAKVLRRLAAKGFSVDVIEAACAAAGLDLADAT